MLLELIRTGSGEEDTTIGFLEYVFIFSLLVHLTGKIFIAFYLENFKGFFYHVCLQMNTLIDKIKIKIGLFQNFFLCLRISYMNTMKYDSFCSLVISSYSPRQHNMSLPNFIGVLLLLIF